MKSLSIAGFFFLVHTMGALACSGGGSSLATMSPDRLAELKAELAANAAAVAAINRSNATLDKAIAVAKGFDVVFGAVVSLVPGGSSAYNAGKTVGYTAMGDYNSAGVSAVKGVVSYLGGSGASTVAGQIAARTVSFGISAVGAVNAGQSIGQAFGK